MTTGLIVFLVVLVVNVLGVSLDGFLYLCGHTTVSQYVRAGAWWIGVLIVLWQCVGMVGLAQHFWGTHGE